MTGLRWTEKQLDSHLRRRASEPAADISAVPLVSGGADVPFAPTLTCEQCSSVVMRTGPAQRYCHPCSEARDLKRKKVFARNKYPALRSEISARGIEISKAETRSLTDHWPAPDLAWAVRVAVPFAWSGSKNSIFAMRAKGHVALRAESRDYRDTIAASVKAALRGQTVVQNKVWVEILVQKPNQRGDAANFVDLVCDALKVAIGIDDRWFSLKRVDWQICKDNPQIFISVGQEAVAASQACSSCGRILPFEKFHKNKATKSGFTRNCRDCAGARVK